MIDVTIRLPGVNVVTERRKNGSLKRRFYYQPDRRQTGIRLPDDPASPAFTRAYEIAKETWERRPKGSEPAGGTVKALIAEYIAAPEYTEKAPSTRREYLKVMRRIEELIGDMPVKLFERKHAMALRDRFRETPRQANALLQLLSILMNFAIDRGLRIDNPAQRPKKLKGSRGAYLPWPDAAVERFRQSAPEMFRTPFELALHTGQRLGDVLKMTWHAINEDGIPVVQGKTGVEIWLPLHPELVRYLSSIVRRGVPICLTVTGRAWKRDHFEHGFREVMRAAGLDGLHFHGLRATAAVKLAEAGCTDAEIQAITGHKTLAMVGKYRRGADQKRLAQTAISKLTDKP